MSYIRVNLALEADVLAAIRPGWWVWFRGEAIPFCIRIDEMPLTMTRAELREKIPDRGGDWQVKAVGHGRAFGVVFLAEWSGSDADGFYVTTGDTLGDGDVVPMCSDWASDELQPLAFHMLSHARPHSEADWIEIKEDSSDG